jgi:hypothetical protein
MIDVLQVPPEVEADFTSGDPDLTIDAMQDLYSLYTQASTESKYDIIAGSRNQFLNGCAALEDAEVLLELVDGVIDVTQAVEELYPDGRCRWGWEGRIADTGQQWRVDLEI